MLVQDRIEHGEERWQAFGQTQDAIMLMVAHAVTESLDEAISVETVRIISARRATRKERRRYEDQDG